MKPTRSQKNSKKTLKEAGQISIFLGIVMTIVVSFLAFIINVGLFVKAKINLQNAADASAFAGAAVQARQLTNVAYLNWELRNTYKEWMFKYYILGQKGLDATERSNINGPLNNGNMNFRLRPFYNPGQSGYDANVFDRYNIPSICIHYGSPHNICEIASIPGLPRFNTVGLPSISEHHESFINTLVATKAEDCSARSNINLGAAMLWAYGTGSNSLFADVPQIAATEPGAWVQSLELAIRVRNLELIINTPPVSEPICAGAGGSNPCVPVDQISSSITDLPHNERSVKAFHSGFRNLGGGINKDSLADPFFQSFRMTELRPNPFNADELSLSGFLIPAGSAGLQKHYLDLQIYPVNYVTFFTLFSSETGNFKNSGVKQEANCAGVKSALPIPGYVTGFTKNPEVLTYYAVKTEAEFVGLFFPFTKSSGINMKAYSAAKPMGGRIGPKLFKIEGTSILPRQESEKQYTINYAGALADIGALSSASRIQAGFPLPTVADFWANQSTNNAIGGNPLSGNRISFVVPNLIYDFESSSQLQKSGFRDKPILEITRSINDTSAYSFNVSEGAGLYDQNQFRMFEANQDLSAGPTMTAKEVLQSIYNARRPTRYEALNYMIPALAEDGQNPAGVDHNGYFYFSNLAPHPLTGTRFYNLFGPLYGPNTLYHQVSSITNTVHRYIQANAPAIDKYLDALKGVADQMRVDGTGSRSGDAYSKAADKIHQDPVVVTESDLTSPTCINLSLAQKFGTFFKGGSQGCGIKPLGNRVVEYFNEKAAESEVYQNYYVNVYENRSLPPNNRYLMSGYSPGPRQGALDDGSIQRPFGGGVGVSSKRNFYSTKFFAIDKVTSNATQGGFDTPSVFMEGSSSGSKFVASGDFININIVNLLNSTDLSEFGPLDF